MPYVILTEYGYASALRLQDTAAAQFLGTLRGGQYVMAASFSRSGISGLLLQNLPSDMTYPSPTIYIFRWRKPGEPERGQGWPVNLNSIGTL